MKYDNCVLRLNLQGLNKGDFICHGLKYCYCKYGDCKFYADGNKYYRDPKTGFIHKKRKGGKQHE